jgi:hypothetical protein
VISNHTKKETDMKHQLVPLMSRHPRRGATRSVLASAVASAVAITLASVMSQAVIAAPLPFTLGQDAAVTCTLQPLTLPLFGATPPTAILDSLPPATPVSATPGTETRNATSEETADVERGAETIVACLNTGNPLESHAIFSTRYLAHEYADPTSAYLPAFEQDLAGATIPVNPPFVFEGIENVEVLSDGRVRIQLTISRGESSWTNTMNLVKEDDAWLIEETVSQGT